jgi:ATP-dependent Clp protease adaptor protein ClpS
MRLSPHGHEATAALPQRIAAPRTDAEVEEQLRLLPRYRVLLHNDDYNEMGHVVHALISSVPSLTADEAMRIMLEAHLQGVAQVIVCPKEAAEHYRERLESFGLTSTIEPV